jgi:hypothetical protein
MKTKPTQKRKRPEFRCDSYEATLTPLERRSLHARLVAGRETLDEIEEKSIPWRSGKQEGEKPDTATLWKIQSRLRMQLMLGRLGGTCERFESYKKLLLPMAQNAHQEQLLDWIMMLICEEVVERTLERLNPEARTAATKLLLKRADQRRVDRRLDMVEAEFKKDASSVKRARKLTPNQKQERIRQILGTE